MHKCSPSAADSACHSAPALPAAAERADLISAFVRRAIELSARDGRVLALLQHGSSANGDLDEFSDLDLTCVVGADLIDSRAARHELVRNWGDLLVARHVPISEARDVLFCLFDPGFVRVDVVFKEMEDLRRLSDRPLVAWDGSGGALAARLRESRIGWEMLPPEELEAAFWLDMEQSVRRLARGELFDVLTLLSLIRARFLGPLILRRAGFPPNGLRRIEKIGWAVAALEPTLAGFERSECRQALAHCITLYLDLRGDAPPVRPLVRVQAELEERLGRL